MLSICILVLHSSAVPAEGYDGKFDKYLTTKVEFGDIYFTDIQNKTNSVQKVCLDGYTWFIYTSAAGHSMLVQAFEFEDGVVGGSSVPAPCKKK